MIDTSAKIEIMKAIKIKLGVLDKVDSQWQTDTEEDKNTCEHKITVKHRFDPSIEIGEKVYPFNASKKLYQVKGEYIKASCGGENILSAWDGKKDNECLMIDNVEREKIKNLIIPDVIQYGCSFNVKNAWRGGIYNGVYNASSLGCYPPSYRSYTGIRFSCYDGVNTYEPFPCMYAKSSEELINITNATVASVFSKYKAKTKSYINKKMIEIKKKYGDNTFKVYDPGNFSGKCYDARNGISGYMCGGSAMLWLKRK